MQPQTDAEMHAWNYGVDLAAVAMHDTSPHDLRDSAWGAGMSGATRTALDALGADLFYTWADRGYATAIAQHH